MKKIKRIKVGGIESIRPAEASDIEIIKSMNVEMPEFADESIKPILQTEGYLSTKDRDEANDVILPSAWEKHLAKFMEFPMLFFGHNYFGIPLGLWYEMSIDEKGLYGKNFIFGTAEGEDVALMVRAAVLKAYSVTFWIHDWEPGVDDAPNVITEAQPIEGSIVAIPMNYQATIEDIDSLKAAELDRDGVASLAEEHKLVLKSLTGGTQGQGPRKTKGVRKVALTLEEVQAEIAERTKGLGEQMSDVNIATTDFRKELDALKSATAEAKDAMIDKAKLSAGEVETKVDLMSKDFTKLFDDLKAKIEEVKKNRIPFGAFSQTPFSAKSLHSMPEHKIKALHKPETFQAISEFREVSDQMILLDGFMAAESQAFVGTKGSQYHTLPQAERIKSLRFYEDKYIPMQKALGVDTGATAGDEFIPTEMSARWEELIRIALRVAPLFSEIQMPTNPYILPVLIADTIGKLITEKYSLVSAHESNEETPGTGNVTWTAKTCRGRIQISHEFEEDSIVPGLLISEQAVVRSIARAIDQALVDGDTTGTHMDSDVTAATDFRKAWKGLRKLTQAGAKKDYASYAGSITDALRAVRTAMGKYGLFPNSLAQVTSLRTYLKNMLAETNVQTLDKYGPAAVILTGELAKLDGIPIVPSEFSRINLNASGVYDGVTTTTGHCLTVNRDCFIKGIRGGLTVGAEFDLLWRVWQVAAFKRMDFQPLYAETELMVGNVYNIT